MNDQRPKDRPSAWEGPLPPGHADLAATTSRQPLQSTDIESENVPHELSTIDNPLAKFGVPVESLPAGTMLGADYEILRPIARGGMGIVYRARQRKLDRIVAVKMLRPGYLSGSVETQRFLTEARAAASLKHRNIVAIYDVGDFAGAPFFSMECVDGGSVADELREGPLSPRRAATLLQSVALAVAFAHQAGILHRDIKPANILLDTHDNPKISDFGLAKCLNDDPSLTVSGTFLGTPAYAPPEQVLGQRSTVTERSDVYSLGATLFHMLTGSPPFHAQTFAEIIQLVLNREPQSPRDVNSVVPRDLETICLKCLEKDPRRRYASAQELADDLARFLDYRPITARPLHSLERIARWCRRHPARLATGFAAVILIAVAVLAGVVRSQRSEIRERTADRLVLLAAQESQRGRWRGALEYLDQARGYPTADVVAISLQRIQALLALNERDQAESELKQLAMRTDLGDKAGEVRLLLGDFALAKMGGQQAALDDLHAARRLGVSAASDAYAQGLLAERTIDAIAHFENALERNPYHHSAHSALLFALFVLGHDADVQNRAQSMSLLFPDDPSPHFTAGLSRLFQDDVPGAQVHFDRACKSLSEEDRRLLDDLSNFVGATNTVLKRTTRPEEYLSTMLEIPKLLARGSRLLTSHNSRFGSASNPGQIANLPWIRESWGRYWNMMLTRSFRSHADLVREYQEIIAGHPDGYFSYMQAIEIWNHVEGAIAPDNSGRLRELFQQAVDSDSLFPFYRRDALIQAISCARYECQPGGEVFNESVRDRTITQLMDFVQRDDLSSEEYLHLADVCFIAQKLNLAGEVCSRWEARFPKEPDVIFAQLWLAGMEQRHDRVLELSKRIPRDHKRFQDMQPVVDRARKSLGKQAE